MEVGPVAVHVTESAELFAKLATMSRAEDTKHFDIKDLAALLSQGAQLPIHCDPIPNPNPNPYPMQAHSGIL